MRKSKLDKELTSILSKRKKLPKKNLGGILSGVGSGAAMGSAFPGIGTAIGAVAGGVMGLLQSNAQKRQLERQKQLEAEAIRKQQMFMDRQVDRQIMSSFPTHGVNQSYFAKYGGDVPSGERIVSGGHIQKLSSDMGKFVGNTHEQGGIKTETYEAEDSEVIENTKQNKRIYSDQPIFHKVLAKELYKILKNF
jgi:hypothetical protein